MTKSEAQVRCARARAGERLELVANRRSRSVIKQRSDTSWPPNMRAGTAFGSLGVTGSRGRSRGENSSTGHISDPTRCVGRIPFRQTDPEWVRRPANPDGAGSGALPASAARSRTMPGTGTNSGLFVTLRARPTVTTGAVPYPTPGYRSASRGKLVGVFGAFPPSDTYGYPTGLSLHGDGAAGVVTQRDAELPVLIGLVGRVGGGECSDDVSERLHDCLHLTGAELLAGDLLSELCFESSSLALGFRNPRGGEGRVDVLSRSWWCLAMRRSQSAMPARSRSSRSMVPGSASDTPASAWQVGSMVGGTWRLLEPFGLAAAA